MTRLIAILSVVVTLAAAIGLYRFKDEAAAIDARIAHLQSEIAHERETINVLRAEWNYLNQPSRIQGLAERYLDLEQLEVDQLAKVSDLPMRPIDIDPYEGSRLGGFAGGSEKVIQ